MVSDGGGNERPCHGSQEAHMHSHQWTPQVLEECVLADFAGLPSVFEVEEMWVCVHINL